MLSRWKNFKLLGLPYLVFILKFEPFLAMVLGEESRGFRGLGLEGLGLVGGLRFRVSGVWKLCGLHDLVGEA